MAIFIYFLCMGLGMGLWVYGLQEWADSTLSTISIYLYTLGSDLTRRLASSSCFIWMKRLHSHTQLVRLQQVN
jgi:drug/metabolite transporter (DMT)-like permease